MSFSRLTFLYPHLFKNARVPEPGYPISPLRPRKKHPQRSSLSTISQHRQETFAQRYGSAAEPQPPPQNMPGSSEEPKTLASAIEKEVKSPQHKQDEEQPQSEESKKPKQEAKEAPKDALETKKVSFDSLSDVKNKVTPKEKTPLTIREELIKPIETVQKMGPPSTAKTGDHKPPHLQAPPYVHHFDTFTLVRDLQKGGFTEAQSVTLMKAVRSLLGVNMDIAREGLVSKSDVENETYLFRAACSELRTEILNARKASTSKMATQCAHLQHEFDILSQKASQESLTLKDDMKGMLNDRKMVVRMEQQARDSAIQELNYKITVALNSDSKSEVEGLRWVLTRRAAIAIASMALLILGSLRYSSYKIREREFNRQHAASSSSPSSSPASAPSSTNSSGTAAGSGAGAGAGGGGGGGGGYTVPAREIGTQTGDPDVLLASVDVLG